MLRSLQSKLFISYSAFILFLIIVFITSYYIYTAKALDKKAFESLYNLSGYISSQLDAELTNMNLLSQKILFSKPLQELFFSDLYEMNRNSFLEQRKLNEIIYTIIGPQFPVNQVNIFQMKGNFIGVGNSYSYSILPSNRIAGIPWVGKTLKLDGKKLILPPHPDDWRLRNTQVVSLCRAFSNTFGNKVDTIIEIQQDESKFAAIIGKALETPASNEAVTYNVFVFNSIGSLVYPITNPPSGTKARRDAQIARFYSKIITGRSDQLKAFSVVNPYTKNKEVLAYSHSDFTDWTVVVAEPEDLLLNPVIKLRNTTILATLAIILITMVLSYFVSEGLTTPIKKIHRNIKNLSLETLPAKGSLPINSGINELEELNRAFSEMCKKLKDSLEEVVSSRSHEIQARLLALQSQMNPHFLYNTIANIIVMAEDKGNTDIVKVCRDLSSMLRYISSESNRPVTIRQELVNTQCFINLMKIRYEDNLHFELYVSEDILDISIPKLVIQPLVENCTKYAIGVDPPWKITVAGNRFAGQWEIKVRDNGPGFNDLQLQSMTYRLAMIDPQTTPLDLTLEGMGLINIYIRLKILFGAKAIFVIGNHPDGGAVITIGGPAC